MRGTRAGLRPKSRRTYVPGAVMDGGSPGLPNNGPQEGAVYEVHPGPPSRRLTGQDVVAEDEVPGGGLPDRVTSRS